MAESVAPSVCADRKLVPREAERGAEPVVQDVGLERGLPRPRRAGLHIDVHRSDPGACALRVANCDRGATDGNSASSVDCVVFELLGPLCACLGKDVGGSRDAPRVVNPRSRKRGKMPLPVAWRLSRRLIHCE